jgi:signal transduction histidine kinase
MNMMNTFPATARGLSASARGWTRDGKLKVFVIFFLIALVLGLHYSTAHTFAVHHEVYRMFFYIPLILATFWFGFWGAISTSIIIFLLYLPHGIDQWEGFSLSYHQLLEAGLFFLIAFILGNLAQTKVREQRSRLRSERLAAVGMAVSEISHDMKSPLMAIGGFAAQVRRRMAEDDPDRPKMDLVIRETARLENMVKDMLNFSRPLHLRVSTCNLSEIAGESIEVMRSAEGGCAIALENALDPAVPDCMLDKDSIKEVVINLIANAVQASPPGEIVSVRTLRRRNRAVLEVTDRGHGIQEEDRKRVFHPFFSRKKGGTGLGLTITKKIVMAHGGSISFYPNPDRGVTFRVTLPLKHKRIFTDVSC